MSRKLSHGPIAFIALASLLAFNSAEAAPVKYEWSSTSGFLASRNQALLETITGQSAIISPNPNFWITPGNMSGAFIYDKDNAGAPDQFGNFTSYFGANLASMASLSNATGVIGTCTADVGTVTVSDSGGGGGGNQDVVNAFSICEPPYFGTDPWRVTVSSVLWVGEGFQNDQNLPMALPPVGAPLPFGRFTFFNATTGENATILSSRMDFREAVQQTVEIDVKPGSDRNAFSLKSKGVIPVAVLGSVDFDATLVDFSTVTFGPGAAPTAHDGHVEDVNGDGFVDMVFHFNGQGTGIACGDTDAALSGETLGGQSITGSDSINTVGCSVPEAVNYNFTQTFGNIAVSGTLTLPGSVADSITVDDLNTLATWDLSFSTIVPDPVFPLEPFSLSESDSSWATELIPGTSLQIDATQTELVFDLTTPFATNAAVVLMSDGPDFRQFRFGQGNQPGFVGSQIGIQGIDIAAEFSPFPYDEALVFPAVSTALAP
jgi:hypothetical protein